MCWSLPFCPSRRWVPMSLIVAYGCTTASVIRSAFIPVPTDAFSEQTPTFSWHLRMICTVKHAKWGTAITGVVGGNSVLILFAFPNRQPVAVTDPALTLSALFDLYVNNGGKAYGRPMDAVQRIVEAGTTMWTEWKERATRT
jgi:hypothetical protein